MDRCCFGSAIAWDYSLICSSAYLVSHTLDVYVRNVYEPCDLCEAFAIINRKFTEIESETSLPPREDFDFWAELDEMGMALWCHVRVIGGDPPWGGPTSQTLWGSALLGVARGRLVQDYMIT